MYTSFGTEKNAFNMKSFIFHKLFRYDNFFNNFYFPIVFGP